MNIKHVLLLITLKWFYNVDLASSFTITTGNIEPSKHTETCRNGYCGSSSYNYILKVFKGLFLSHSEIAMLDRVNNAVQSTPLEKETFPLQKMTSEVASLTVDDGSICCSTHVQHISNTTMVNIFGTSTNIVHMSDATEPTFQYIPHASCVATGSCPGTCVLEGKIITLLTIDENLELKFDLFEIPGYCSCKGISSIR